MLLDNAIRRVQLIPHQNSRHLVTVVGNLLQPLFDADKGGGLAQVKDDQDTVGAAVVGGRDGAETLLAGRVPDLNFKKLIKFF